MKVKELIEKLQKHDPEMRVVVDLMDGPYDVYEHVTEGGLGDPLYEPVVWITLSENAKLKKSA